jgi:hypothetical protein
VETAQHVLLCAILGNKFSVKAVVLSVKLSCFLRSDLKFLRAPRVKGYGVDLREMLFKATFLCERRALYFLFAAR